MLAKYPFEMPRDRKLSKREIAQALRWAMQAELDAVSFYEQLAEGIEDERVRKVFYDIANEEKTHFGEFMAVLKEMDEELAENVMKGFKEVEELTGIKSNFFQVEQSMSMSVSNDYTSALKSAAIAAIDRSRSLYSSLPKTRIHAQSVRVDVISSQDGVKAIRQEFKPIPMFTRKFFIGLRELGDGSYDAAIAVRAAELLAMDEESYIVKEMSSGEVKRLKLGNWENTEEALNNLMSALQELSKASAGPFAVVMSPKNFAKLLRVHEKSGRMLIEVLKEIFRGGIIVTPCIEEKVIVFANSPSVLELVIGEDLNLKELGPEENSMAFLISEALALRVKIPQAIAVLE